MSDLTTVDDSTPPSDDTEQPSSEPTETVESLKVKLAAEAEEKERALEEAKRWKNRVKEENPPKKSKEEDYADWRIDNRDRIALVKEQYDQEIEELEASGAKLNNAMREKALRLAESTLGIKKAEPKEPIPSGGVDRGGQKEPEMTPTDHAFGVKPETKKKYANLEREWQ